MGLVLAHYRYDPDDLWELWTLGRTFALFDAMLQYVEMTNPWGSSDDAASSSTASGEVDMRPQSDRPSTFVRDRFGAAAAAVTAAGGVIHNRAAEHLPLHIREMLGR